MGPKNSKVPAVSPQLSDEDLQLLLDNTTFTKQQIIDWHRGFLTDCPSGNLTKKKFIEVYKQFYPNGRAEKFCEHVFRTFDRDKNGYIDFKEFLIAISITSRGDLRAKLEWAFTMYDIDGNGKIDRKEMKKIIDAIYDLLGGARNPDIPLGDHSSDERVDEIFKKIDVNSDDFVSREEFINGCMRDEMLRKFLAPSA